MKTWLELTLDKRREVKASQPTPTPEEMTGKQLQALWSVNRTYGKQLTPATRSLLTDSMSSLP